MDKRKMDLYGLWARGLGGEQRVGKKDGFLQTEDEREALTPLPVIDLLSKQVDAGTQDVTGREEDDDTQWVEGGKHGVHPVSSLRVVPQDPA